MRTSTIAAEFLDLGSEVCYVGNIEPMSLILERFKEIGLHSPVLDPGGFESRSDSDILLIDSYSLHPSDPFIAKERWFKSFSISDSVTPNYDVDLVIKPSLTKSTNTIPGNRILSGPEYILIRNSISKNSPRKTYDHSPLRILIVGGGSDPSRFCTAVAKALMGFPNDFNADIFSDNVDLKLQDDSRIRFHKVSTRIDHFARDCDVALTLASSLSMELIAREIPVGIGAAFENQMDGFQEIIGLGLAIPIGILDSSGNWNIDKVMIRELIESESLRKELRSRVTGLIDAGGPRRITLEILNL
jgi:spore coat polysaccharide biosynthesis predicted glycosyltransferase SpsG